MLNATRQTPSQSADLAILRKAILKLRWMGMEEEAATMIRKLASKAPRECLPMAPLETD